MNDALSPSPQRSKSASRPRVSGFAVSLLAILAASCAQRTVPAQTKTEFIRGTISTGDPKSLASLVTTDGREIILWQPDKTNLRNGDIVLVEGWFELLQPWASPPADADSTGYPGPQIPQITGVQANGGQVFRVQRIVSLPDRCLADRKPPFLSNFGLRASDFPKPCPVAPAPAVA